MQKSTATPWVNPAVLNEVRLVDAVLAASRRVIAARANPKLDWGQTRAMEELSFALDELTQATQAYDKALGIEPPVVAEAG